MGAPYFFKIKDIDTLSNFCKKQFFNPATIKNDNGAAVKRIFFVRHERNQQPNKLKKSTA